MTEEVRKWWTSRTLNGWFPSRRFFFWVSVGTWIALAIIMILSKFQ